MRRSKRYSSNIVLFKVEGKGNGIKTVIVNMVDVARALLRPPTYVTKYFGCELGAQTQFDIKVKKSDSTRQSFVVSIHTASFKNLRVLERMLRSHNHTDTEIDCGSLSSKN